MILKTEQNYPVLTYSLEGLLMPFTMNPIRLGIIPLYTSYKGNSPTEMENIVSLFCNLANSGEFDILIAPEYAFLSSAGPLTGSQLGDYLNKLKETNSGTLMMPGTFVWGDRDIYNSCFLIHNNKVIYRHDKTVNGGTPSWGDRINGSIKYGSKLGLVSWEGFHFGIEICAENGDHAKNNITNLDILFLISSGQRRLKSINCIREGGYGIVCDGFRQHVNVHQETEPSGERSCYLMPSDYLPISEQN